MVIPAMDYIDEAFTNGMLNKKNLDPAIRAAIGVAKKTLNRYYTLTDVSELYRIAMGMYISQILRSSTHFHSGSITPPAQARILQSRRLVRNMDIHGK